MNPQQLKKLAFVILLLFAGQSLAQESTEFLTAREIQNRLQTAPDAISKEAGRLVFGYRKQTPEVICAAVNMDASQSSETVFEALNAGATRDEIPVSCECLNSDHHIESLMLGALVNAVNSGDIASSCLPYLSSAQAVKKAIKALLAEVNQWDRDFILSTSYDTLTDMGVEGADVVLVDALVEGGFLSFDGVDCGVDCMQPAAETIVQNIIDVQQDVRLSDDLFGGPAVGSPEGPDTEPSLSQE